MSRKYILITIVIFVTVGAVLAGLYFVTKNDTSQTESEGEPQIFPFGKALENISDRLFRVFGESEKLDLVDTTSDQDKTGAGKTFGSGLLRELSTMSAVGAFATTTEGNNVSVFYVERETGHVYRTAIESLSKNRVTNTTIPGIQEALWGDGGESLIVRYVDENGVIKSFSGTIHISEKFDTAFQGSFLQDDITHIVASPTGTKIFTLFPFGKSTIGAISRFDNKEKKEVLVTPFPGWLAFWPSDDTLTLATKASGETWGSLYSIDAKTGAIDKLLSKINGLTALPSPDMKHILYSESADDFFATHIYDVSKRESLPFPLVTLPEKCVWSTMNPVLLYCGVPQTITQGIYPDLWYQGVASFSDAIWEINIETGAVDILAMLVESAKQNIDVVNPFLNEDETYFIFTNKNNNTLWSLKITP